jgi:hypothetical protein
MDFSSINWLAVLLGVVVTFFSAFVWFSPKAFYPTWWKAMGKNPTEQPGESNMILVFGLTLVAIVVQNTFLALVIDAVARATGNVTLVSGLATGLVVGVITATASLGHRLFAGQGLKVWAIEVSNDVLNLAVAGVVFSFFY